MSYYYLNSAIVDREYIRSIGQVQANKNSGSVISTKLELRPHDSDDRSAAGTDIVTLGSVQATNGTKGTAQEGTSRCA